MHLNDEGIQRLLHGEIRGETEAELKAHLEACPECARRLLEATEEDAHVFGLLETLDHPAPIFAPAGVTGPPGAPRPRLLRWAAGVIGVLGVSTAAFAAPGSPVPGWFHRVVGSLQPASSAPAVGEPRAGDAPFPTGISVPPGPHFIVEFEPSGWSGNLSISLEEVHDLSVEVIGSEATFSMDTTSVLVEPGGGAGMFRIRIPLDAPRVEVRLADRILFSKVGGQVVTAVSPDGEGIYRVQVPPARQEP